MLFCGLLGRLSDAIRLWYHLILSDLVKSILTPGLVRAKDPLLVLENLCQKVFRAASVDLHPSAQIAIFSD